MIDIKAYANLLYSRIHEARILKRVEIGIVDWEAQPNMCHHNVTVLYLHDNSYTPVRGWLYFALPGLGYVKFVSHSAVKTPEGEIVEITPKATAASQDYPFLEGNLTEEDYEYIVDGCGYSEINFEVKKN